MTAPAPSYLAPAQARAFICPIARVSGAKEPAGRCQAHLCILWRWKAWMADDPRIMGAIQRETTAILAEGHKVAGKPLAEDGARKRAVSRVSAAPDLYAYRDPEKDRGYCGLGGRPE